MFVKCKSCNGTGNRPDGGLCLSCDGHGGFNIPDGMELCPKCKGAKRVKVPAKYGLDKEEYCPVCKGEGFVKQK